MMPHITVGGFHEVANWRGILYEVHSTDCTCSYCREHRYGLVLPECKKPNSWRAIRWKWRGRLHVVRWTLSRHVHFPKQSMGARGKGEST